jgi:hypothetical protein
LVPVRRFHKDLGRSRCDLLSSSLIFAALSVCFTRKISVTNVKFCPLRPDLPGLVLSMMVPTSGTTFIFFR